MISHLLLLACSLLVIGHSVCAMNHMGPKTHHGVRIAYGLTALAGILLLLVVRETPMGTIPWSKVWLVLGATGLFVNL